MKVKVIEKKPPLLSVIYLEYRFFDVFVHRLLSDGGSLCKSRRWALGLAEESS